MIANKIYHLRARDRRSVQQPPQHPGGVGAAIDIVADMQQHRLIRRTPRQVLGDDRVQVGKLRIAAMDVADGIDPPPWRHDGGGPGKLDHCDPD